MTQSGDNVPLRVAVFNVIRQDGTGILAQPKRLLSNILDEVDPDAKTTQPFELNCTDDLLELYRDAVRIHTAQAIDDAAQKATPLLADQRMLQPSMAKRLACELAFGIANALSIECSDDVRSAATQDMRTSRKPSSPREERRPSTTVPQRTDPTASTHRGASASSTSIWQNSPVQPAPVQPAPVRAAPASPTPTATQSYSLDPKERRGQAKERGVFLGWNSFVRLWCIVSMCVSVALASNAADAALNPAFGTSEYWTYRAIILIVIAVCYGIASSFLRQFRRGGVWMFHAACAATVIATFVHANSLPNLILTSAEAVGTSALVAGNLFIMFISLVDYNSTRQRKLFSL